MTDVDAKQQQQRRAHQGRMVAKGATTVRTGGESKQAEAEGKQADTGSLVGGVQHALESLMPSTLTHRLKQEGATGVAKDAAARSGIDPSKVDEAQQRGREAKQQAQQKAGQAKQQAQIKGQQAKQQAQSKGQQLKQQAASKGEEAKRGAKQAAPRTNAAAATGQDTTAAAKADAQSTASHMIESARHLAGQVQQKAAELTGIGSASVGGSGSAKKQRKKHRNAQRSQEEAEFNQAIKEATQPPAGPGLMSRAQEALTSVKDTVLQTTGLGGSSAGQQQQAPHRRRQRGGRARGNRRMKMREVPPKEEESVVDTLGDKAKQIKQVTVDNVTSGNASSGGSVREKASELLDSVKSRASGIVETVSSKLPLVGGNHGSGSSQSSGKAATPSTNKSSNPGGSTAARESAGSSGSSSLSNPQRGGVSGSGRPPLVRKNELPALGTPDSPQVAQHQGRLAVNPGDQSSITDKLSFAKDQITGAIGEQIERLTENADDTDKMETEEDREGVLEKASKSLDELKSKVAEATSPNTSTSTRTSGGEKKTRK